MKGKDDDKNNLKRILKKEKTATFKATVKQEGLKINKMRKRIKKIKLRNMKKIWIKNMNWIKRTTDKEYKKKK